MIKNWDLKLQTRSFKIKYPVLNRFTLMQGSISVLAVICFLICTSYVIRLNEEASLLESKRMINNIFEKSVDTWSVWNSFGMKKAIYADFERIKSIYPVSDIKIIDSGNSLESIGIDELIFSHSDEELAFVVLAKITKASHNLINIQNIMMLGSIILIILISMLSHLTYRYVKNEVFGPVHQIIRNMDPKTQSLSLQSNIKAKGEMEEIVFRISEVYRQAKSNLRQKVVSETVESIAHDLRKPFAIANDLCNYVSKHSNKDPLLGSAVKTLSNALKHTDRMIQELLDPQIRHETFCCANDVVKQVAFQYQKTSKLRINIDVEHAEVRIPEHQLIRVLENVIENADQATGGNTLLNISVENRGDEAILSIANTGSYVPNEIRKILFDRGYSSKAQSSKRFGLGLAIVKKIVEEANGFVRCESEKGICTKFIVHIPTI